MFSKRIRTIASLVDKNAIVLDVGTDHGYLPIYLLDQNIAKKVYASDISKNALKSATDNIAKYDLPIKTIVSDGLENIDFNFDTLTITGMGYFTIKSILESGEVPDTIILQSNNDHCLMRKYMQKRGYILEEEIVLNDKKIYYTIMKFVVGSKKLNKTKLMYGIANNVEYLEYLLEKNNSIIKKVNFKRKITLIKENKMLEKLLKENRGC